MLKLFGDKYQYLDSEYDLAFELGVFKTPISLKKDKLERYMNLECILDGNPQTWYELLKPAATNLSDERFEQIHKDFALDQETVEQWFKILARGYKKRTTIVFYGTSNSGKSLIANALVATVAPGMIQRDCGTNDHWLEHIYMKSVLLWEEPTINMINIEDVKLILGGETIIINRKNKALLERTNPASVIITTNRQFWQYDPNTLKNRCWIYDFGNSISTKNTYTKGELVAYLCKIYGEHKSSS